MFLQPQKSSPPKRNRLNDRKQTSEKSFFFSVQDWLAGSRPPYTQAVANIRLIGTMTAHMIAFMVRATGLDTLRQLDKTLFPQI